MNLAIFGHWSENFACLFEISMNLVTILSVDGGIAIGNLQQPRYINTIFFFHWQWSSSMVDDVTALGEEDVKKTLSITEDKTLNVKLSF